LLTLVLWAVGIFVPSFAGSNNTTANTVAGLAFFLGLLSALAGVIVWLLVKPRFGPRGKVMATQPGHNDNLVQLSRVHTAFVAAVQQHQHARAAQFAAPPSTGQPPASELPSPPDKF
jgi:predicted small integral membrane protein